MQFNLEMAEHVVDQIGQQYSVDLSDKKLIRLGENAVFASPMNGLVIRVHRPTHNLNNVKREAKITNYLSSFNFPSINPSFQLGEPVQLCDNYIVSFWDYIEGLDVMLSNYQLFGQLVHDFHKVTENCFVDLPQTDIKKKIQKRFEFLKDKNLLSNEESVWLDQKKQEVDSEIDHFESILGEGVIHGDMHSGNLIKTSNNIWLCDYENISIGFREWDLFPTLVNAKRFVSRQTFDDFIHGYMNSNNNKSINLNPLCKAKELSMVSWILQNRNLSSKHNQEATHRLETLVNNSDEKWNPF